MDPFAKLVKTFITDHPELAPHILEAGGEYTGTCKKSRKPKKGKCKPGFEIYDRPLDDGKFEKCCFRLFNDGKSIAEYMVSLQMKKDEISKRGTTFHELLVSGDYKNTVFTTTKNGKTKEYRFTEKTLRRKIRSLQAKYKKVEALAEKKKKQIGLNNFTDDTFLAMKGAIQTVKEENRLSGGGLFEDLIVKGAAACLNAIVTYFSGKKNLSGGGVFWKWFKRFFMFFAFMAFLACALYLLCDNTLHRWCEGVELEDGKLKYYFCQWFGVDLSGFGLSGETWGIGDEGEEKIAKKRGTIVKTGMTAAAAAGAFFGGPVGLVLGLAMATKLGDAVTTYVEHPDAWMMDKGNPIRRFVASKWVDKDGKKTTCQWMFDRVIVEGLCGITVTSKLKAWMNVGGVVSKLGIGAAATYFTGNPAAAMGALLDVGKQGANAYMNQPSFIENQAVQSLGSAALATGVKYATTDAYSLETRQIELEESIEKMIQAKTSGIPIDEKVLARQRQELNRVAAQIAGINEQKSSKQANIQKGMNVMGQANAMSRNVVMSQVNAGIDVANTAANAWGATMQKRELTEKEKNIFSGIQKGTNMASDIAASFGKPVGTEALGTAVTSFVGSKYHGESTGAAAQKAQQAFQTNALTHLQSRREALTNAASAAYGMIPEKYRSVPGKETPSDESQQEDNRGESKQGEVSVVKTETLDERLQRGAETATVVSGRCSKVSCKLGKLKTPKGNRCCRKKLRGGDATPFLVGCEFLM